MSIRNHRRLSPRLYLGAFQRVVRIAPYRLLGCVLALGAVSVAGHAQNPILDGHIYYYTGAATISTSLIDYDPINNTYSGNDVVIGRAPGGASGPDGDIDLLTPYTVTISGGARIYGGISVFNACRLIVDHIFDSDNGNYALSIDLADSSQLEVNGLSNIPSPAYYNIYTINTKGNSQATINGNTVNSLYTADSGQMTIAGGYVNDGLFTGNSRVSLTGGILGSFAAQDNARVSISGGTLANYCAAFNTSQITVSGGSVLSLYLYGDSSLLISGGTIGNRAWSQGNNLITMTAGTVNELVGSENSTILVNGGTIAGILGVADDSTATINGGSIAAMYVGRAGPEPHATANSQAVINNGSIGSLYANSYSTTIVNGGTIANARLQTRPAPDGSATGIVVNGGAITGLLTLGDRTTAKLNGGSIGSLTAASSSLVDLHGGTIGGPIHLLDTGFLNIYGIGLGIIGSTPWSEVIDGQTRTGIAYTVTGLLQNNSTVSSLIIYDQDDGYTLEGLNPARQFSLISSTSGPLVIDGHIYYYTGPATINTIQFDQTGGVEQGYDLVIGRAPGGVYGADGDINLGTSPASAYTVTIAAGAEITGNNEPDGYENGVSVFNYNRLVLDSSLKNTRTFFAKAYDNSFVDIHGGDLNSIFGFNNSHLSMDGGKTVELNTADNATGTITGGFVGIANAENNSHITITGGTVNYASATSNGTLNIQAGVVDGYITGTDSAAITIAGGTLGNIYLYDSSSLVMSGGSANLLSLVNNGHAVINNGTFITPYSTAANNSSLVVNNGNFQGLSSLDTATLEFRGGIVTDTLQSLGNSHVTISGGTITNGLTAAGNSTADLNGGSVGSLKAYENATANLRGGSIGGPIQLLDTSFLTLYGNGLAITGSTPWSQVIDGNLRTGVLYTVSGVLQNNGAGSSFQIYDQDGGYTDSVLNPNIQFNLVNSGISPVILDGDIYYITAPFTANLNLPGYDIVIGRAPGGVHGAPGDIDLGTTDAAKFTATFDPGTVTTQNASSGDGYAGISVFNKNTAIFKGGSVNQLSTNDMSVADIRGGNLTSVSSYDSSNVLISGGNLSFVTSNNDSHMTLSAGTVQHWNMLDNSDVSITGGTVTAIYPGYFSHTAISGGNISLLNTYEHNTTDVSGTVKIASAIVGDSSFGVENAVPVLNQTGGTIDSLLVKNYGTVNLAGGTVGHLETHGNSLVNLKIGGLVNGPNGNLFDAGYTYDNSTLNVSGGTVTFLQTFGNSTVNVTAGHVGNNGNGVGMYDNSVLNVSGGVVDFIEPTANSKVNITGGTVGSVDPVTGNVYGVRAEGASKVDISGGTVKYVEESNNATVSIGGAATVGGIRADRNSIVNLTGGSLTGSTYLLDSSFMNIYGHDLQITGTTPWSLNLSGGVRSGLAWSVSGFLQDNASLSSLVIYDQDAGFTNGTLNPGRQFTLFGGSSNSPVAVDSNIFYAQAATTVGFALPGYDVVVGRGPAGAPGAPDDLNFGTTDASKYTVTFGAGATLDHNNNFADGYDGVNVYNKNTALFNGGNVNSLNTFDSATADIRGGSFANLTASNDSQMVMSAGTVQHWNMVDNASVSISGGTVVSIFPGYSTRADFSGGNINTLITYEHSTTTVSGTAAIANATVGESSFGVANAVPVLNQSGGTINNLTVENYATYNMTGGSIGTATVGASTFALTDGAAVFNQSGGSVGNLQVKNYGTYNLSGGSLRGLTLNDHATANMTGGTIDDGKGVYVATLNGSSQMNISGGVIPYSIMTRDNSVLNVNGGRIGYEPNFVNEGIDAYGNSTVNVTDGDVYRLFSFFSGPNTATASISGGHVQVASFAYDTHVIISGSAAINSLNAAGRNGGFTFGRPEVAVSGGSINSASLSDHAHMAMTGGSLGTLGVGSDSVADISGGTVGNAASGKNGILNLSGSARIGTATLNDTSRLSMTGGTIDLANAYNKSVVSLKSGHIGTLHLYNNAQLYWYGGSIGGNTIYGLGDTMTSLVADSYTLSNGIAGIYTDLDTDIIYSGFFHDLTGFFTDGSAFSTHYFEATGDSTGAVYHPQIARGSGESAAAPEASSLALCLPGLALLGMGYRRRFPL